VNFTTEVGILASGGAFLTTDANGQARDSVRVSDTDIAALGDDDFLVGLEVGGAGSVVAKTFTVRIQRPPDAAFSFVRNQLTVAFEDQSTNNPTSWTWSFGDGQTSRQQNPTHTYSTAGTYTVTLTVRNAIGEDSVSQLVQVTQ
jgi:PKD repeat protein